MVINKVCLPQKNTVDYTYQLKTRVMPIINNVGMIILALLLLLLLIISSIISSSAAFDDDSRSTSSYVHNISSKHCSPISILQSVFVVQSVVVAVDEEAHMVTAFLYVVPQYDPRVRILFCIYIDGSILGLLVGTKVCPIIVGNTLTVGEAVVGELVGGPRQSISAKHINPSGQSLPFDP
jgi:hypothetical protein